MTIGIILTILALAQLGLGLRFIFGYERSQATVWYGLFCIAVAIYVGGNGVGYITDSFFIGERVGWVGGMLTAAMFLPFSYSYPYSRRKKTELIPLAVWPAALFVPGLLLTNVFVGTKGTVLYGQGYQTMGGPLFWFLLLFFGIYWIWSMGVLFSQIHVTDGQQKWRVKMIIFGVLMSLLFSIGFDIIYPLFTVTHIGYAGSMFSSIWLGFTSYVLLKK